MNTAPPTTPPTSTPSTTASSPDLGCIIEKLHLATAGAAQRLIEIRSGNSGHYGQNPALAGSILDRDTDFLTRLLQYLSGVDAIADDKDAWIIQAHSEARAALRHYRCRTCMGDGFVEIHNGPYTRPCKDCQGHGHLMPKPNQL